MFHCVAARSQTMKVGDGEMVKTIGCHEFVEATDGAGGVLDTSQSPQRGDLPSAGSADVNLGAGVGYRLPGLVGEAVIVGPPPKQGVGVLGGC